VTFTTSFVPEIRFGEGVHREVAACARGLGAKAVLVVLDGFLAAGGLQQTLQAQFAAEGIAVAFFSDFAGEPKLGHVQAATEAARGRDIVIGIGGGSALDIAKIAACAAAGDEDPMHYALAAHPLPRSPLKKILVPTTAGTGSETSATTIFTGPHGKKLWIWGRETKADLVLLDPALTISLPPDLTAWCGLDAFVHAFEAATNRNAHAGAALHAHAGMRLVAEALEIAVKQPDNIEARGKVLLGSCYAGTAIDNCGTAIAHNISHALAGLAPVHHGLATALAFEATLGWLAAADTPGLASAARACGLRDAAALPAFVGDLMDRCGVRRALPRAFSQFGAEDLAREMRAPENQPMRLATIREVSHVDIDRFAAAIMALPRTL
jgi:alcohol dehydrogenase class IV